MKPSYISSSSNSMQCQQEKHTRFFKREGKIPPGFTLFYRFSDPPAISGIPVIPYDLGDLLSGSALKYPASAGSPAVAVPLPYHSRAECVPLEKAYRIFSNFEPFILPLVQGSVYRE